MVELPRIMFITYGAGHAEIVSHLLPELAGMDLPKPVVLALTTAPSHLTGSASTLRRCADYLPMDGYEGAFTKGADLARGFWTEGSEVSWEDTCAYLGVSMCDLERSEGPLVAQKLYDRIGRKAFCPVRFLEHVLGLERPDIIVTTCHVRMERAATIAARNLGLRSVLIEDLLGYSLLGEYPYGQAGDLISPAEWPDRVVVLNPTVKDILVRNGYPKRQVVPLGQPVLADWKRQYRCANPLDPFEGGRKDKPLVSYITPARLDILHAQSTAWIALAGRRPDLSFTIKLHPSVAENDFLKRYGPFPDNLRILSKEPVLDVIKGSDLAVLFRSTVGILCLISSTPMIVWDSTGEAEILPYAASGAAKRIDDDTELEPLVDNMLQLGPSDRVPPPHPLFDISVDAAGRIAGWLASGAPECPDEST